MIEAVEQAPASWMICIYEGSFFLSFFLFRHTYCRIYTGSRICIGGHLESGEWGAQERKIEISIRSDT